LAVPEAASRTVTVKVDCPAADGVPVIAAVVELVELNDSPAGNVPAVMDQV
jgi:hypothetical protein